MATIKWLLYDNRSYPDQEQLDKGISKVGIAKLITRYMQVIITFLVILLSGCICKTMTEKFQGTS